MSNLQNSRPIPREIGGITPDDSAAIDDLLNGVHEIDEFQRQRLRLWLRVLMVGYSNRSKRF